MIRALAGLLGRARAACSCSRTTPRSAPGTFNPATFLRCLGPEPWRTAYVEPVASAPRRPLRREPVPLPALLPVPGDPQAGAGGRARPLLRLARGDRHRPRASTTSASSRTTGSADARRLGPRLGGLVRRHGDHAVHVLPAGRRPSSSTLDPGGDHLRPRAARDVPPGQAERVRARVGAGRHLGRRLPRERAPVVASTTSRRRRSTCSCAASTSTRPSAAHLLERAPAAAGLRPGAEVLARVQPARRARRDLRHRARRLHRAASATSRARSRSSTSSCRKRPMPTLLLEIGCEELPAVGLPRGRARSSRSCAREHLGREPTSSSSARAGSRSSSATSPEQTDGGWIKGPPRAAARAAPPAGFARRHGVEPDGARGARRLPRRRACPGGPIAEVAAGAARGRRPRPQFAKSMRWDAAACASRGRCAGSARSSTSETLVAASDGTSFGHRFTHGRGRRSPSAEAYAETLRAALRRAGRGASGVARIVEGLDALGGGATRSASSTRSSTSSSGRSSSRRTFDERFLALPRARDRHGDAVAPALLPARRATASRSSRTAATPTSCAPATSACSRAASRTRRSPSSATSRSGSTRSRDALARDHVLRRRRLVRRQDGAARRARRAARRRTRTPREAARLAKADQAAELVREFPELEGYIGAEYARLAGYPEAVCARDRGAVPAGLRPAAPLPATEAGRVLAAADKLDNLRVAFALGQRPTGSRDPYGLRRAAIGLCRLALEGGVAMPRDAARSGRRATSSRSGSRASSTCRSSSSARRAPSAYASSASVARSPRRSPRWTSRRLDRLHTAYTRAERLAGRPDEAAPELDSGPARGAGRGRPRRGSWPRRPRDPGSAAARRLRRRACGGG